MRRPAHTMTLVLVLMGVSACTSVPVEPSASASAAASASSQEVVSPSLDADWSTLADLEPFVTATSPLTAVWPSPFATATDQGLWLPNGNDGPPAVVRLDPESLAVVATVALGGEAEAFPPDAWASAPSANGVWVALAYQKAVVLIDPQANVVSRRIEVDATPYSLVEYGSDLWIVDWENSEVLRIDVPSGEERLRIRGIAATEIAIGDEGLWVNEHSTNYIVRLDPTTGEVLARVEIGGRPGMILGLGGVWARSDDEKLVVRVDPATNAVVATIPMPSNPTDLEIAGGVAWVATTPQRGSCERSSYLVRIDPDSNQADGIMSVPCMFGLIANGAGLWVGGKVEGGASILRLDVGTRT